MKTTCFVGDVASSALELNLVTIRKNPSLNVELGEETQVLIDKVRYSIFPQKIESIHTMLLSATINDSLVIVFLYMT